MCYQIVGAEPRPACATRAHLLTAGAFGDGR
eukprot:CAMPEP_0206035012 /NCGR_PEP_ID=MMETSP1466-20131121/1773_1 /ASSEMBLY_ACC=CAM_ASM_001126 /TAXON_ID=44452 /ORGANISM="Pavlova gyrans, Strain CCMP608" /LENGTH=30 /DNA_ID= /DNA_START= /DNA_END= /DNA_ORIENTATION=